jgi:hypothetical protein
MDLSNWMILAIVVIITFVIFRFRKKIRLTFEGFGAKIGLRAEDKIQPSSDREQKAGASGSRNVNVGRDADKAKIITGDDNKVR